ncbi:MAG TPA: hypothetical protein VF623_07090, partial [Segetibacter sp.]
MLEKLSTYIDVRFLIRFIVLFVPVYFFHVLYLGITDPKNYYSPFLDNHLNYIRWLTSSINYTASIITYVFGTHAFVDGRMIFVKDGASVLLEFPCLGLGIMGFWIAFIVAHNISGVKRLYWALGGAFAIWLLNCWRIAILLMSLQYDWNVRGFDHHDLFNNISYAIICLFI